MSSHIELRDEEESGSNGSARGVWERLSHSTVARVLVAILGLCAGAYVLAAVAPEGRSELQPLSRVATLPHDAKLDPHHIDSRLILIGDVHGMSKELHKLLDKVDYNRKKDKIVFLGDLITKGYDSLGVVDFAIDHNAYCVRGNHEDEILSLYAHKYDLKAPRTFPPHASRTTMTAGSKPKATLAPTYGPTLEPKALPKAQPTGQAVPEELDIDSSDADSSFDDSMEKRSVAAQDKNRDMPLVKKLKKRHIEYLASCPAILDLGQVSKRGIEAVAVHGGLLWDERDLEEQDIMDVLRIRSIVPPDFSHGSENPDDGEPWFNRWNDAQLSYPKPERLEVFYGHDASKGLQLRRYSKGLDTRCQRGGKLSAYVVRVEHSGRYHEDLVQIKC